jgi:hypothetical protein
MRVEPATCACDMVAFDETIAPMLDPGRGRMPGQPECGRRAASTPASAHDMLALAYVDGAPGLLRFTARQNKPMLSENSPILYCVINRFWLMLFTNERGRRGAGSVGLRPMARQLLQKIQAQTPRVVSLRRGVGRFFCVNGGSL